MRDLLLRNPINNIKKINKIQVAIYGAGSAGAQLAMSLQNSSKYKVSLFFDDNPLLNGRSLYGIPIISPEKSYLKNRKPELVLLAIPSVKNSIKRKIIKSINSKGLSIMQIPSIEEITSGKMNIDSMQPIELEDLLSRESKLNVSEEAYSKIKGNSILITGAGGSIGSELCRMVLKLKPSNIILLDISETNLYHIHQELTNINSNGVITEIHPILGSALDEKLLKQLFLKYKVNIIFHSAAYKHVPLVEDNIVQGILNNVFATKIVCKAALETGINQVVMISTDKAVRPTSAMGATKRLAELVVKGFSDLSFESISFKKTNFSMVRFGNVLGSSGSVVPLFKNQISKGGPITLTHKDVMRYFMTISEAAKLVIESSALSKGGELYLLDMGEPVRIKDMAEQLIRLSGLRVKNKQNPDGDIEIVISGLRKGEKLYEELLIDSKSEATSNSLIFKAVEKDISKNYLFSNLEELENSINDRDQESSIKILKRLVPEWNISK